MNANRCFSPRSFQCVLRADFSNRSRQLRPSTASSQHYPGSYLRSTASSNRHTRTFHTSRAAFSRPKSTDRGPPSTEDTQTDFANLDVLGNTPAPTTSIDACTSEGFHLNSGLKMSGCGALLIGGEAFRWQPWAQQNGKLKNQKGQWEVGKEVWGLLDLVWPKPDLLIIGTGPQVVPVSPTTRKQINDLGIRLEVQDTRNAAAQFNLLATERGVQQVAAAMIPIGWKEAK